jgi:hypothetical protein
MAGSMIEIERKVHTWRANTSSLLGESMEREGNWYSDNRRTVCDGYTKTIGQVLSRCSTTSPQIIASRLSEIITESLDLDQLFSKQVAYLNWASFNPTRSAVAFDPEFMDLERGESHCDHAQPIQLVLSPALIKQGKSSGDDFAIRTTLIKIKVTNKPPPECKKPSSTSYLPKRHWADILRDFFWSH